MHLKILKLDRGCADDWFLCAGHKELYLIVSGVDLCSCCRGNELELLRSCREFHLTVDKDCALLVDNAELCRYRCTHILVAEAQGILACYTGSDDELLLLVESVA